MGQITTVGIDLAKKVFALHGQSAQRLMKIRGIGPTTALAIVATVGDAREFKNGRQFAAWIGLVPNQHSTGGKSRRNAAATTERLSPSPTRNARMHGALLAKKAELRPN